MRDHSSFLWLRSLRSFLWPIERHEVSKILPMACMLFLICVSHGLLRTTKDTLVVMAEQSSAAVIPFLKVWGILPMAVVATLGYTWLSNRYSRERVFYLITSTFLLFFALFTFVLYPYREQLHLNSLADQLSLWLPAGAKGFVAMIRYWSFSLFYILAELWGSMVMMVLFWGFVNDVTRATDAPRFYGVLSVSSNLGSIGAGAFGLLLHQDRLNPWLPFGHNEWEQTLVLFTLTIVLFGIVVMGLYGYLQRQPFPSSVSDIKPPQSAQPKIKKRPSLFHSFSFLARSPYLLAIAGLVLCYNLSINLVETPWKEQLRHLYRDEGAYNRFMNQQALMVGLFSTLLAVPFATAVRRFGWTGMAIITPICLLVTATGFFFFLILGLYLPPETTILFGLTPAILATHFGTAQNCLSKAAKYSLFDATKEMAFIPLDREEKRQGKAAIDGVGSRCGKAGGSLLQQGLFVTLGSVGASVPIVGVIVLALTLVWIYSVKDLGKRYHRLLEAEAEKERANEEVELEERLVESAG